MAKYFVQYPMLVVCGLKCSYCFHREAWDLEKEGRKHTKYKNCLPFTFSDYKKWRDKFLPDGTEFLMELHSGEISYRENKELCLSVIDEADKEIFQLQTNGMGSPDFYSELIKRKDKIDRIGFTFHRKMIKWNKNTDRLAERFAKNVFLMHKAGVKVIVKELLIPWMKIEILQSKRFWEGAGLEFRIQDIRENGGFDATRYTAEELVLIHPEYQHGRENCSCRVGYKNIVIRGCDVFGGDVLGCWHDPSVIGHIGKGYRPPKDYITDNGTTEIDDEIGWYNPNYIVGYDKMGGIAVRTPGRKKLYRGGFTNDLWSPEIQRKFPHREKNFITSKNFYHLKGDAAMVHVHQNMIIELQRQIEQINAEAAQLTNQLNECMARRMRAEGAIEGLQMALQEIDRARLAEGQSTGESNEVIATASPEDLKALEKQEKDKARVNNFKSKIEFMQV